MADQIAGHRPGDLGRGVREEPVEKRDACVLGSIRRCAHGDRGALAAQPTYVVVLVPRPDGKVASL
jgi:hypothetical protein